MRGLAVGIDIGTSAVTTVAARQMKGGKLRIFGVGRARGGGMRRGVIVDVDEVAKTLRASVAEASRAAGTAIRSAVVGIGGVHLGSSSARGVVASSRADGEITEEDVARAVRAAEGFVAKNPNREIIHIIPREFRIDGAGGVTDPVGLVGMKLEVEVLVVDGAKPALQNIIRACELVGVEVEDWAASTLAASELLLTKPHKELGVMLLDLGAGTSDFVIFEEGRVLDVGAIPIGGSHITSDIAIGLRTSVAAAEAIKLRYAESLLSERPGKRQTLQLAEFVSGDSSVFAVRDLADIVGARLTDIFELATKALKRVGRAGLLAGGVVLSGAGADIPGIQDTARRELKLPAEVARAISRDDLEDVIPPRLAIPVGLILWQRGRTGFAAAHAGRRWGNWVEELKRLARAFIP